MPFSICPSRRFPFLCIVTMRYLGIHMTRLFLILFLLVSSSGIAYSDWGEVDKNEEAGMTIYMDPDTYRRKGNLVEVWLLYDFKTPQTFRDNTFLSFKSQTEYDCAEERVRHLVTTYFSGNMGNHKVVYNDPDEGKWGPVPPNSVGQTLWTYACGKK